MANLWCILIPGEVFQSSDFENLGKSVFEKVTNGFFLEKSSIVDVRLGSKYASGVVLVYIIRVIRILV